MSKTADFNFTDVMFGVSIPPVVHDGQTMVSANGLHKHLGVKTDFSTWIADHIAHFGLEEGLDYVFSDKQEHLVSLDAAKGLALVQRTAIGRETIRHLTKREQLLFAKAVAYAVEQRVGAMQRRLEAHTQELKAMAGQFGL